MILFCLFLSRWIKKKLKQELEKDRAEKKKLQERNSVLQKQIYDLKEELSFFIEKYEFFIKII
jgi:cell division protein FtsB